MHTYVYTLHTHVYTYVYLLVEIEIEPLPIRPFDAPLAPKDAIDPKANAYKASKTSIIRSLP
jgi:hypothetical protein